MKIEGERIESLTRPAYRFRELDHPSSHHGLTTSNGDASSAPSVSSFGIENVPRKPHCAPATPGGGGGLRGQEAEVDWASELRPSMRKLRQGMDSLCKTARLTCSVLRLHQTMEAVELSHAIKYRRDVCFSQALTRCGH